MLRIILLSILLVIQCRHAGENIARFTINAKPHQIIRAQLEEATGLYTSNPIKVPISVKISLLKGLATAMISAEGKSCPFSDEVLATRVAGYAVHRHWKSNFKKIKMFDTSHILIKIPTTKKDGSSLEKDQIKKLEIKSLVKIKKMGKITSQNFSEKVKLFSDDLSTISNKGDRGYLPIFAMTTPVANTVLSMKRGEISNPIRTIYGFQIILFKKSKMMNHKELKKYLKKNLPGNPSTNVALYFDKAYQLWLNNKIDTIKKKFNYVRLLQDRQAPNLGITSKSWSQLLSIFINQPWYINELSSWEKWLQGKIFIKIAEQEGVTHIIKRMLPFEKIFCRSGIKSFNQISWHPINNELLEKSSFRIDLKALDDTLF